MKAFLCHRLNINPKIDYRVFSYRSGKAAGASLIIKKIIMFLPISFFYKWGPRINNIEESIR